MSLMNMWERVKDGVCYGQKLTLRRRPVETSPSGRFVFEYQVIYLETDRSLWKGMSWKLSLTIFRMELAK